MNQDLCTNQIWKIVFALKDDQSLGWVLNVYGEKKHVMLLFLNFYTLKTTSTNQQISFPNFSSSPKKKKEKKSTNVFIFSFPLNFFQ